MARFATDFSESVFVARNIADCTPEILDTKEGGPLRVEARLGPILWTIGNVSDGLPYWSKLAKYYQYMKESGV